MQKLAERLIERHVGNLILDITLDVCDKHFDECFKEACQSPNPRDTTIGTCYRNLEKLANKAVEKKLNDFLSEVTSEMGIVKSTVTGNPFAAVAAGLWDEFLYYYDIKGYVENIIGDEWSVKAAKLQQDGILDDEGDYKRA